MPAVRPIKRNLGKALNHKLSSNDTTNLTETVSHRPKTVNLKMSPIFICFFPQRSQRLVKNSFCFGISHDGFWKVI
jgi:hypothetical protein